MATEADEGCGMSSNNATLLDPSGMLSKRRDPVAIWVIVDPLATPTVMSFVTVCLLRTCVCWLAKWSVATESSLHGVEELILGDIDALVVVIIVHFFVCAWCFWFISCVL